MFVVLVNQNYGLSGLGLTAVNFTLTTLPCTAAKSSCAAAGVNSLPGQQAIASSSSGVRVCRDTVLISVKPAFVMVCQ